MIITNVGHKMKLNPKVLKDCSLKHLESIKKETVAKRNRVMMGQVTYKSKLECVLDMKVQSESGLSWGSGPS